MHTRYILLLLGNLLLLSCSVKSTSTSAEGLQNVKITSVDDQGIENWNIIFFENKKIKKGIILSSKTNVVSNRPLIEIGKSYELDLKRVGMYPPDNSETGLLLYGHDVEIIGDSSSFVFYKDVNVYTTEGLFGLKLK